MGRVCFGWFFLSSFGLQPLFCQTDLDSIVPICKTSLCLLLPFSVLLHQPVGIGGSAARVAQVPDWFLGQTSRSQAGKIDGREKWWRDGESVNEERGSSSATEPLQLFKWPLSLCTCSLCLVWILKWPTPKRQISRRRISQRAKAERAWLLTFPATAVDERQTVCAADCVTLKREVFLSRSA